MTIGILFATVVEVDLASPPPITEVVTDDHWAFRYCPTHLLRAVGQQVDINENRPFPGDDPELSAGRNCWPVVTTVKSIEELRQQNRKVLTPEIYWHHSHRLAHIRVPQGEHEGCSICNIVHR